MYPKEKGETCEARFWLIDHAVKRRGITVAELSRRVEMIPCCFIEASTALETSSLSEFEALCAEPDLEIEDFKDCLPEALKAKV